MGECPEVDEDACVDACDARATTEAHAQVLGLTMCFEDAECTDETCFEEECAAPFDTCIASSSPEIQGSPFQGGAPPGSIPAELVGTWEGVWDGNTEKLVLNGDGSGSLEFSRTWQQSACQSFSILTWSGNIVVDESYITIYATDVVRSVRQCSPPTVDTPEPAVIERLQWHRPENPAELNTIFIIDSACAAQYPGTESCKTLGCPIALYCTMRMVRQ
jgi:hypothetical protein